MAMGAAVDLTGDAAVLRPPFPTRQSLDTTSSWGDEPSPKRRRVEEPVRSKKILWDCIRNHVIPHVHKKIRSLAIDPKYVDLIAEKVISQVVSTGSFRRRVEDTAGCLTAEDERRIAEQTSALVETLYSSEGYGVESPEPKLNAALSSSSPMVLEPKNELLPLVLPETKTTWMQRRAGPSYEETMARLRRRRGREPVESGNSWFHITERPYRMASERENIRRGVGKIRNPPINATRLPTVYHIDFTSDEIAQVVSHINKVHPHRRPLTIAGLESYIRDGLPIPLLVGGQIKGRTGEDIRRFCSDIMAGSARAPGSAQVLSFSREEARAKKNHDQDRSRSRISSLLYARELEGNAGFGRMRRYENFQNELTKAREDELGVVAEYTNCAGDIATVTWVSNGNMLCGTTAHSDAHNQQYNKPGNLVLCSVAKGTLRAFLDHRIPRPIVEKGDNSTESMRQSQDQWLYSSVVCSDYDPVHRRAYTSSFDGTVKVWKVDEEQGGFMELLATWKHEGNVNFVAAAKDGSGRVASAVDAPQQAVRIYTVDPDDVAASPYVAFSCSRTDALYGGSQWAYYPAALRWGVAPGAQHLLAVGYSPRGLSGEDADIPEDKRDSGEIILWDANAERPIPITTATAANVFEIAWHPKLPRFICATSPCGLNIKQGTRTQVHIFQRDKERDQNDPSYHEYQSLDCPAKDINELTFMPNSLHHAYITAGCTDGKVYVWDTAQPESTIHVLSHGDSLDGFNEDREDRDTGIKFTGWGATLDRFYTGSSDGVVKIWNVRDTRQPLVRTLLEAPAPISSGAFSPDLSRLVIGDASGRVFLLSIDQRDECASHVRKLPGAAGYRRFPVNLSYPREESSSSATNTGTWAAEAFLRSRQLVRTGSAISGIVQGPQYSDTDMFCREAHEDGEPSRPLLASWERQQRYSLQEDRGVRRRALRRLGVPSAPGEALRETHLRNKERDLDVQTLGDDVVAELVRDGALLSLDGDEEWVVSEDDDE